MPKKKRRRLSWPLRETAISSAAKSLVRPTTFDLQMTLQAASDTEHQRHLSIHEIRRQAVCNAFQNHIGQRTLLLMSPFPFLIIGEIRDVVSDFLYVDVETTNVDALEGRVMRIHLDEVEVFVIEDDEVRIPRIDDFTHQSRGDHR